MSASGPVDWDLARSVAAKINRNEPKLGAQELADMKADFVDLTARAEELVTAETGLRSLDGAARGVVADRAAWVDANIDSFQRLLRPMLERMEAESGRFSKLVAPKIAGAEVGTMLGWMSTRVLGQYDLLVIEDDNPQDQDIVYYVGSNVAAIENRYGFEHRDFRLWLALHEVTHRAQFTGVPWMREHFLSMVTAMLDEQDVDDGPGMVESLRTAIEAKRAGGDPLADGGLSAIFASPAQRELLDKIGGLMSLLEGHGDVTMDRAGLGIVKDAPRFGRVLRERRKNSSPLVKLVQRLSGLEAKLAQYAQGESFVEAVEAHGGRAMMDLVWSDPAYVPVLEEIKNPQLWIDRVNQHAEIETDAVGV